MISPALYIGFLISSAIGLVFHLLRGGSLPRMILYLATSWISFSAGHMLGEWLDWRAFRVGSINLLPALLATLIGLLTASILAGRDTRPKTARRR